MRKTPLKQHTSALYRFVFVSRWTKTFVAVLFFSFLIQPAMPVFASEGDPVVPEESVPEPIVEAEETTEEVEEEPVVVELAEEETEEEVETEEDAAVVEETLPIEEGVEVEVEGETEDIEETVGDEEIEVVAEVASSTVSEEANVPDSVVAGVATSSEEDIAEDAGNSVEEEVVNETGTTTSTTTEIAQETSSSTEEVVEETAVSNEGGGGAGDTVATTTADVNNTETESDEESEENTGVETSEEVLDSETEVASSTAQATSTETEVEGEEFASTTEVSVTVIDEDSYVINEKNYYQFGMNECVSAGDGTFYCTEVTEENVTLEDAVFAAKDSDGDSEIYVRIDGVDHKITDNTIDDFAPHYDVVGKNIVWHSLINDRYQIMKYSLEEDTAHQITDTAYNNMEPVSYNGMIVWQAWIGGNWEIMLLEDGELIQLTDNQQSDISPHIRDTYVTWQSRHVDGWWVHIFDRITGVVEEIEATEGAQVENPRFLLVYDSRNENGDVETIGFDLDTKKVTPLSAIPAPIPEDIPEPDQTGETRALIQNKGNTIRDDVVELDDEEAIKSSATSSAPVVTGTSTATTTAVTKTEATLDLSNATSTEPVTESPVEIIEEAATSTPDHIEDVLITPLASSTESDVE